MVHTVAMYHQVKKKLGVSLYKQFVEFRVWAPFAKEVSITGTFTPDGPLPLVSEEDGYWSLKVKHVEPGHHYKYLITTADGDVLEKNDPRARVISSSDKGFSIVSSNEFEWDGDTPIARNANDHIIYELHIGTFNRPDPATQGTFDSAIERLDYLYDLGITTIELMLVTSMAYSYGWGYAPNHMFSVESSLGGRHGLMKFVKECHKRGISVLLDVVYNHFSGDTDLWQFDGWREKDRGGIYFYNDERGDTPWGGRPDYGRPEVRQFILDNIAMWLDEYHIDGLRVDSTIYMRNTIGQDNDTPHDISEAWSLMQDINSVAHSINPSALIIAEDSASNNAIVTGANYGGGGFDSQWELGFPHGIRRAFGVDTAVEFDSLGYQLTHSFSDNPASRVIFIDSHDTAANGSVRLNEALSPRSGDNIRSIKQSLVAATALFTTPGIPLLLQGCEFMQEGSFNDWKALDWERASEHSGIVQAYKHLIDLRKNRYGDSEQLLLSPLSLIHVDSDNGVVAYTRGDSFLVIMNFGGKSIKHYSLPISIQATWHKRFDSLWNGYDTSFESPTPNTVSSFDTELTIPIASHQALIFSR